MLYIYLKSDLAVLYCLTRHENFWGFKMLEVIKLWQNGMPDYVTVSHVYLKHYVTVNYFG